MSTTSTTQRNKKDFNLFAINKFTPLHLHHSTRHTQISARERRREDRHCHRRRRLTSFSGLKKYVVTGRGCQSSSLRRISTALPRRSKARVIANKFEVYRVRESTRLYVLQRKRPCDRYIPVRFRKSIKEKKKPLELPKTTQ